jgi:hypothetical protein
MIYHYVSSHRNKTFGKYFIPYQHFTNAIEKWFSIKITKEKGINL